MLPKDSAYVQHVLDDMERTKRVQNPDTLVDLSRQRFLVSKEINRSVRSVDLSVRCVDPQGHKANRVG